MLSSFGTELSEKKIYNTDITVMQDIPYVLQDVGQSL